MCVLMMDIVKEKSPSEKKEGLDVSTTQEKWVHIL